MGYTVEVTDLSGSVIVADLFYTDLTIAEALNAPGAVTLSIPLLHADATRAKIAVGAREVRVYRTVGASTTRVWGGYLVAATADLRARTLSLQAEGYFGRLRRRITTTDLVYKATDQLDIAWGLIAATQSVSTLGITRGSSTLSGVTRDAIYCIEDRTVVADAITDLAVADNGFDFWIDPDKVWRTAYPRRGSTISTGTLTLSASDNLSSVRVDEDADSLTTQVLGYGETVNCVPSLTTVSSTSAITAYGLHQSPVDISEIRDAAYASDHMDELLRLYRQPVSQMTVVTTATPYATPYGVGDVVTVSMATGWATLTQQMRVLAYQHSVRGNHEETTLTLDSVTA